MSWNLKLVLSALWVAGGTFGYLIVPEAAPLLLPLAMVLPILWYPNSGLMRQLLGRSWLARLLAVASIYLLINAQWSTNPVLAYLGVGSFFLSSLVVHVVSRTLPFAAFEPLRAMCVGFYGVYAVVASLLCIEILLENPIHLWVFQQLAGIAPTVTGAVVENGVVRSFPPFFLNKHMAALTFLFWPAALAALHLAKSTHLRALLLAGLLPALLAVAASAHESSKLAVAGSLLVFGACMILPRLMKPALVAGWAFACVAVVPITSWMYAHQWYKQPWLQGSAQHRVVIWGVTGSKIAEAPIFGHGMVAARDFNIKDKEQPVFADGTQFPVSTGPHAHNVYLQVWFDTGAAGAVLLLAIGLYTLMVISYTGPAAQPTLYAAFAGNALMAGFSYSVWTRWFLVSYGFSVVFAVLAWAFARSTHAATADRQPLWEGVRCARSSTG